MLDRIGLERRDGRNLLVVSGIVAVVVLISLGGEPLFVRSMAALIVSLVTAITFLVVTIIINRVKPDHW